MDLKRCRFCWIVAPILVMVGQVTVAQPSARDYSSVVINEFLTSNRFTNRDEFGRSTDWVELHNRGDRRIDLEDCALSDDINEARKWVFPSVSLGAGGYLVVWLSGKNRAASAERASGDDNDSRSRLFEPTLLPLGVKWRYVDGRALRGPLPAKWTSLGFDDRRFRSGRSGFGYGPDHAHPTRLRDGASVVFVRRRFTIKNLSAARRLALRIDYDDGFVAYLNGRRVAAANAPNELSSRSRATARRESGVPEVFDLKRSVLRRGKNVLAIAALNISPSSSDLVLRPELGVLRQNLHATFKLKKEGGHLLLSGPDGERIAHVEYPKQVRDHSYGRTTNGEWRFFLTPTAGAKNHTVAHEQTRAGRVRMEPAASRHDRRVEVSMGLKHPEGYDIRFTTDGSLPDAKSRKYEEPLALRKTTVLRAASFVGRERSGPVVSKTYFVGSSVPKFRILSITMDPEDYSLVHDSDEARGRASERRAHLELIEADGKLGFATECGLRLHGGYGRRGDMDRKKSYRVYFRGAYGKKSLDYPLFPDGEDAKVDKLVLRAGLDDCVFLPSDRRARATYLRDQLIRDLHGDMGAVAARGTWCLLYVNRRPRGLFNVTERIDQKFLNRRLGKSKWDLIMTRDDVQAGSAEDWMDLRERAKRGEFSKDRRLKRFRSDVDIERFVDYLILNMWGQNFDWPHNNWYVARKRADDAKWFFMCWDAEYAIGLEPAGFTADAVRFVRSRRGGIAELFEGLWGSVQFQRYFRKRARLLLSTTLSEAEVSKRIRALAQEVRGGVEVELKLYGGTMKQWTKSVEGMLAFAARRGPIFLKQLERAMK